MDLFTSCPDMAGQSQHVWLQCPGQRREALSRGAWHGPAGPPAQAHILKSSRSDILGPLAAGRRQMAHSCHLGPARVAQALGRPCLWAQCNHLQCCVPLSNWKFTPRLKGPIFPSHWTHKSCSQEACKTNKEGDASHRDEDLPPTSVSSPGGVREQTHDLPVPSPERVLGLSLLQTEPQP